MLDLLKSKTRKSLLLLSGRFSHLRKDTHLRNKWYGNAYGGFYVYPDQLNERSIVYSFGIGEDISFDEDIIARHNCKVFGFDPTPKSIKWVASRGSSIPPNFKFLEYGISDKDGTVDFFLPKNPQHVSGSTVTQTNVDKLHPIPVQMRKIATIMQELGHQKNRCLKNGYRGSRISGHREYTNSKSSRIPNPD